MELLDIVNKFNYKNVIVVDDENYFDVIIESFIDDTMLIYEELITNYGKSIMNTKISDCEEPVLKLIQPYIQNPYESILKIKNKINFIYKSRAEEICEDNLIEGNTLWFVDIKMDELTQYNHIKYLYNIFSKRSKDNKNQDIFILFSNEAHLYKSIDKVIDFFKSKVRITINEDFCVELNTNFIEKSQQIDAKLIYSLILKGSKSKYFNLLKKSIDNAVKNFKENVYDSDNNLSLFHYDYLTEGQPFDEVLYNIFEEELKKQYISSLNFSIFSSMNNAIDYYLEKTSIICEKVMGRVAKVINEIEHPVILNATINKLRHDLSFGDVFLISEKRYMLVNQLCDITIRDTGDRMDLNALLIPIEFTEMNSEKINKYKKEMISSIVKKETSRETNKTQINEELKNKIKERYNIDYASNQACDHNYLLFKQDELIYNVKFSKGNLLLLPFWCLDNVSCNDEGVVDFKYSKEGLRYPLKKCIEKAEKSYEEVCSKINGNFDIFEFISIAYLGNNTKCTIKRIGKFESEVANQIYKEFINNQTRIPKKNVIKF